MILPDLNLLIHAYNSASPQHDKAKKWWEGLLNGRSPVGLTWVAMNGFIRITTHPRALSHPLEPKNACASRAAFHRLRFQSLPRTQLAEPVDIEVIVAPSRKTVR